MAKPRPPSRPGTGAAALEGRSRSQNETELVRLRKMRASLPPEKAKVGRQIDRRMGDLERALNGGSAPAPKSGGAMGRLLLVVVVAVVALVVGFVGIMVAGHMAGL